MLFLICMSIPRIVTNMNACPTLNFNSHRQAYSVANDGQKIGKLDGELCEVLKNEHMVANNLLQNVIPATCQVISKLLGMKQSNQPENEEEISKSNGVA
jgi:hypothetical protein